MLRHPVHVPALGVGGVDAVDEGARAVAGGGHGRVVASTRSGRAAARSRPRSHASRSLPRMPVTPTPPPRPVPCRAGCRPAAAGHGNGGGLWRQNAFARVATGYRAARRAGISPRGRRRTGGTLVACGEFSLVVAGLAAGAAPRVGPPATACVLILVVVGPLTARWIEPLARRLDRRTVSAPAAQSPKSAPLGGSRGARTPHAGNGRKAPGQRRHIPRPCPAHHTRRHNRCAGQRKEPPA